METLQATLQERYNEAKEANPKLRIRDIARTLGVGEAQLAALNAGNGTTVLGGDFKELLKEIQSIGYVMALTRNNNVVHERKGVYNNVSFEGPVGLVLDADIDLRLFMMHWKHGFAVTEGERKSLQFFDKSGEAVHKIYLNERSNEAAYEAIVAKYKAEVQTTEIPAEVYAAMPAERPDTDIDVASFQQGWRDMQDSHEFFGLMQQQKLTRTQALRLAPDGFVKMVANDTLRKIFEAAAAQQVPVMVFVSSRGCIQIHTGTVTKLVDAGPWFNVLDPEFNMHLKEGNIAASYIVKKPGADGIVTSLEIFDDKGDMIAQFFGKRKPGVPELESWKQIVHTVTGL